MIRLFVALPLPKDVRNLLSFVGGGIPGARWTLPENFHITLKFIGNVDERVADDIVTALDRVRAPAFEVAIRGVGAFDDGRRARLLYAAVEPSPGLMDLEVRIGAVLARVPGVELNTRRFVPHVTLARLKDPDRNRLGAFLEGNGTLSTPSWTADHFALYSSATGNEQPVYTLEERFELGL
jgi:2'-5' RNA ligase